MSGRIQSIVNMLSEGRVGFRMDEVMSGEHVFEPGCGPEGRHHMHFVASWGPRDLTRFLNPFRDDFMVNELEGTVSVDFLCKNAPCRGSLALRYFADRTLRYSFDFDAQGRRHRFVGEKVNIWPWNLPYTHTTCFGTVVEVDTGKLVSRSVTHFRLHTLPAFVASLRLA
ncbi:MAG: hypothetical protein ABIJ09_16320 [Pseudomonadota bacterium]